MRRANVMLHDFLAARLHEDSAALMGEIREHAKPIPWYLLQAVEDVKAKFQVVEKFNLWGDRWESTRDRDALATMIGLRTACLLLASAYREHPDFKPEWGT